MAGLQRVWQATGVRPGGQGQRLLQLRGFRLLAGLQHQTQSHHRRHHRLAVQALGPQAQQGLGRLFGGHQAQGVDRVGPGFVAPGFMQQVQGQGPRQTALGHQPAFQGLQQVLQGLDDEAQVAAALGQVQALVKHRWGPPEGPWVGGLAIGTVQALQKV